MHVKIGDFRQYFRRKRRSIRHPEVDTVPGAERESRIADVLDRTSESHPCTQFLVTIVILFTPKTMLEVRFPQTTCVTHRVRCTMQNGVQGA